MNWPKVSFVTCTYNRPKKWLHLLEEVAESVKRNALQYRGEVEWILLNDCPTQHLLCALPFVKVINFPTRFTSLGAKLNVAIQAATGEIICPMDDDDVCLSWRATQAAEKLKDYDAWRPSQVWYVEGNKPPVWQHNVGIRHHAGAFRKSAWELVDGYPGISGAQDQVIEQKFANKCRVAPEPPAYTRTAMPASEWAYIYLWGRSDIHLSAIHPHEQAYKDNGDKPVESGIFLIEPKWHRDWLQETVQALPK